MVCHYTAAHDQIVLCIADECDMPTSDSSDEVSKNKPCIPLVYFQSLAHACECTPTPSHTHTHTHTLHFIHLLYFQLTYIQFHFSTSFLPDHSHLLWIGFHLPPMPSAPHSSSSVDCSQASADSVISAMLFANMWRSSPPVDSFSPCAKSCSASLAFVHDLVQPWGMEYIPASLTLHTFPATIK